MESNISRQRTLQNLRAACFCSPNYERSSSSVQTPQVHSEQPQPQSVATPPVVIQSQSSVTLAPPQDQWYFSQNGNLPAQAVHVGYDVDRKLIYVGRVFYDGDFIPAKAFPTLKRAYFPYQGQEINAVNFEYLIGDKYIWVPGQPFPHGAVFVNTLSQNERLYVGRCKHGGSLLCGKFIRSQNRLYVTFDGREISITNDYEILVHRDRYTSPIHH